MFQDFLMRIYEIKKLATNDLHNIITDIVNAIANVIRILFKK